MPRSTLSLRPAVFLPVRAPGKARFWREGRTEHDIEFDIERAAKFTVRENERTGPRFVKFKPFVAQAEDVAKFAAA